MERNGFITCLFEKFPEGKSEAFIWDYAKKSVELFGAMVFVAMKIYALSGNYNK
jgi:hypothetical protein